MQRKRFDGTKSKFFKSKAIVKRTRIAISNSRYRKATKMPTQSSCPYLHNQTVRANAVRYNKLYFNLAWAILKYVDFR